MTNEEIIKAIKEEPATQEQMHSITKLVYALFYIIEKEINPSKELIKEAVEHGEDLIQSQLNKAVEGYKKEYKDEFELYDKLIKLFK